MPFLMPGCTGERDGYAAFAWRRFFAAPPPPSAAQARRRCWRARPRFNDGLSPRRFESPQLDFDVPLALHRVAAPSSAAFRRI